MRTHEQFSTCEHFQLWRIRLWLTCNKRDTQVGTEFEMRLIEITIIGDLTVQKAKHFIFVLFGGLHFFLV